MSKSPMATATSALLERLRHLSPDSGAYKWLAVGFLSSSLGFVTLSWYRQSLAGRPGKTDSTSTDPPLLRKSTTFETYRTVSGHVYPRIRTFYHEHPQTKKLPANLPLLVFVHGLGGSAAQFAPLLASLVNVASCLAIDLPGCGRSEFAPEDNAAYTTASFAELLFAAIERFRDQSVNQKIVLVGHSMGCSIAALLASANSPLVHLCSGDILGMIALCPRSTALTEAELIGIERLQYVWSPLFDLLRLFDRRGGVDSRSVLRVVGVDADSETKKLQLRFNQQSKSAVFQKVLLGILLQERATAKQGQESILGKRVWAGLKVPLFLVTAKGDKLAPPKEVEQIAAWLRPGRVAERPDSKIDDEEVAPDQATSTKVADGEDWQAAVPAIAGDAVATEQQFLGDPAQPFLFEEEVNRKYSTAIEEAEAPTKHAFALKTTIFPAPASHGLLYATKDVRVLSGLMEGFLAKHVDRRLSPGWQLTHMTTSGKWDVKNLTKWQSVDPCSEPIGGVFRAMKTMREIDETHNPREFVKKYSWKAVPDGVAMIVDISHDIPVYKKNGLEDGGVEYHKFPTVSKSPPTEEEVDQFNNLIDTLRQSPKIVTTEDGKPHPTIGVHCHYGFNRTGFFVVAYLIERVKWKLEDALDEFAKRRPPGIKHNWFVDQLYTRYAVKIERRGTIVG